MIRVQLAVLPSPKMVAEVNFGHAVAFNATDFLIMSAEAPSGAALDQGDFVIEMPAGSNAAVPFNKFIIDYDLMEKDVDCGLVEEKIEDGWMTEVAYGDYDIGQVQYHINRCNVPIPHLSLQYTSLCATPDLQTFPLLSSMHAEGCNAQAVEASFSDAQLSLRVEDRNAPNVTAFLDAELAAFTSCDRPLGKLLSCLRAEGRNAFSAAIFSGTLSNALSFPEAQSTDSSFLSSLSSEVEKMFLSAEGVSIQKKTLLNSSCVMPLAFLLDMPLATPPLMPKAKPLVKAPLAMPLAKMVVKPLAMPVTMPLAMQDAQLLVMLHALLVAMIFSQKPITSFSGGPERACRLGCGHAEGNARALPENALPASSLFATGHKSSLNLGKNPRGH